MLCDLVVESRLEMHPPIIGTVFHNTVTPDIVDLFSAEIYAVPIASPHPLHPLVVDRVPHMYGFLLSTDSAVRVRCTPGAALGRLAGADLRFSMPPYSGQACPC